MYYISSNNSEWLQNNKSKLDRIIHELNEINSNVYLRSILVNIVDNDTMYKLNNDSLSHRYDTDVITFFIRKRNRLDVELIINKDFKLFEIKESIFYLFIHGLLHSLGFKDDLPILKKRMLAIQDSLYFQVIKE